jgi:hypothetical protein
MGLKLRHCRIEKSLFMHFTYLSTCLQNAKCFVTEQTAESVFTKLGIYRTCTNIGTFSMYFYTHVLGFLLQRRKSYICTKHPSYYEVSDEIQFWNLVFGVYKELKRGIDSNLKTIVHGEISGSHGGEYEDCCLLHSFTMFPFSILISTK